MPDLNAKFLVDTGSTRSFMSPNLAQKLFPQFIANEYFSVSTSHGTTYHDSVVNLPKLQNFPSSKNFKFYLFNFSPKYDGLIGFDLLSQVHAQIDCEHKLLKLPKNKSIKLLLENENSDQTKPLKNVKFHYLPMVQTLAPRSEQVIKIPVQCPTKEGILPYTKIGKNVEIPQCLVTVKNNFAIVTILNKSEEQLTLNIETPFILEPYIETEQTEQNFIEKNFYDDHDLIDKFMKQNLKNLRLSHLNQEEYEAIRKLCYEFRDILYCDQLPLSFTNQIKHSIKLKDDTPISTKSYRFPEIHKGEIQDQIDKMLKQRIIQPSNSPWNSPVWIVPKKKDASGKQKWRVVIDYRKLNERTINDKYPIPNITEILDKLGNCNYFTTLDLTSGFHQIEVDPQDVPKTSFSVNNAKYEFLRMPFGLRNAPATFQRVMDNILRGIQNEKCLVYLDDIIVFSTSLQEHIQRLRDVFTRLRKANLKIQLDKSEFLCHSVPYLGHIIGKDGVRPNPDKIEIIKKFPVPKTSRDIKSFLGLLGYYRRFIKNFAKVTKPLTSCLKKDAKIEHTPEFLNCFETCKKLLCNDPILQYPNFSKEFILTTDASNYAIGAVLSQGSPPQDRPIAYASRTLNQSETRYSTIEKELLAIVWAVKHFRPYLFGRHFKIYTDHRPLVWLFSLKEPNSKLVRWRLRLEEYDYEIIYKKGKLNANADALSRITVPEDLNYNDFLKSTKFDSCPCYTEVNKDILSLPCDYALAHCVSKDFFMNAGLALRIKNKFGGIDELISQNKNLGEVASLKTENRNLYYLITKNKYFDKPLYSDLFKALVDLKRSLKNDKITKLAIPKLGCGLDKLSWSKVRSILNHIFSNSGIKILVCNYTDKTVTDAKLNALETDSVINQPGDINSDISKFMSDNELDEILSEILIDGEIDPNIKVEEILESPVRKNPSNQSRRINIISNIQIRPPIKSHTVHSSNNFTSRDPIPILDEIVNNKPYQLRISHNPLQTITLTERQDGTHKIIDISIPTFNRVLIKKLLLERIIPGKTAYMYFRTKDLYNTFNEVYTKDFDPKITKIISCSKLVNTLYDKDEKLLIIQNYHESKTNHRGISETLERIQRNYYWCKMKQDINEFINACEICQRAKYSRISVDTPQVLTETPSRPFQIVHADVFQLSKRKYLTFIDKFSKFAQAYEIVAENSTNICDAFIKFFSAYGIPEQIVTDNASYFSKSETFKNLLNSHKIKVHFTTPNHHDGNAPVNKFHSTMLEHYRLLKEQYPNETDLVPYVIIAYNNTIHSTTGYTPFELVYGHTNLRDPSILTNRNFYTDYVNSHADKVKSLYEQVTHKEQERKQTRNEVHEPKIHNFKVNDMVYITAHGSSRNKSSNRYAGPFKIVELLEHNRVSILNPTNNKLFITHVKELRPKLNSKLQIPDDGTDRQNDPCTSNSGNQE